MNKEEMISEIERYLSHVIAKDFPLPKAIRLMYEEYKNSNKAWEKIYDEDQDYIGELNDKILDLEFKIEKQQKEIENYQILKDDIEGHRIAYVDTPEFEENYISKDKIREIKEKYRDDYMTININNRSAGKTFKQAVYYEVRKVIDELLGE